MLDLEQILPDGILETDHVHVDTYDETCSRCRRPIADADVPLLLWLPPEGRNMLAYCERCNGFEVVPHCRVCGCWDCDACVDDDDEPCGWAEDDLCTACAGKEVTLVKPHNR